MHARWFKVRTGCRECGFHATAHGDARDVVRALDGARDGVAQCATCRAPIHEVEAWEDRWDGWYVSGFRGTRPGDTWEEDGDSDYVRTYAREYVCVVRAPQMAWDGSKLVPVAPVPVYFRDGVESHYATEEEARANWEEHEALPEFCPGDHVYLQVHRSELEVRA